LSGYRRLTNITLHTLIKRFGKITGEREVFVLASGCDHHCLAGGVGGTGCKGNLAVLRLITQASKGGSKENI
jgi:hypothetical protein